MTNNLDKSLFCQFSNFNLTIIRPFLYKSKLYTKKSIADRLQSIFVKHFKLGSS
jgi:hypothetical protein